MIGFVIFIIAIRIVQCLYNCCWMLITVEIYLNSKYIKMNASKFEYIKIGSRQSHFTAT